MPRKNDFIPMAGRRFGRLVVESDAPSRKRRARYLNCVCDCGGRKQIARGSLVTGCSTSCGCVAKERIGALRRTHGMSNSGPEYKIWSQMIARCRGHKNYGARGIKVCERWLDVKNFLSDMGPRPSSKHSIERRDNNGNYEPSNCFWATKDIQVSNTRRNVYFDVGGKKMTMKQAASAVGMEYGTLRGRLKLGWSKEKALSTPVDESLAYNRKNPR